MTFLPKRQDQTLVGNLIAWSLTAVASVAFFVLIDTAFRASLAA